MKTLLQFFGCLILWVNVSAQAPIISVTPDSLSEDLLSGKTSDQTLTIYNNGGSDLIFEINVKDDLESLFFNSIGNYSIVSITQPLEATEKLVRDRRSYSGNSFSITESSLFEKNEKYFEGDLLVGGMKILLITSGTVPNEIKNALLNFPDVQQVDVFDAYNSTPELSQLLPYHSAIVMNGYPVGDPAAWEMCLLIMSTPAGV